MTVTALAIGDAVTARCTKCRSNSEHVVLTLAEAAPATVQCRTCNRQHKYRPPSKPKPPVVSQAKQQQAAERREWEQLRPGMDAASAAAYTMSASYKVNALISHPQFGLGVVQRVAGPQKIEVLFEDGRKMMRCK